VDRRLRRSRSRRRYPGVSELSRRCSAETAETLNTAAEIIDAAAQLIPNLGFL